RSVSHCSAVLMSSTTRPCYSLIIGSTPRSTLFPYTTLFRSRHAVPHRRPILGRLRPIHPPQPPPGRTLLPVPHHRRRLRNPVVQDRKSTRLNSSHVKNSYAVFCLKKKTPARRSSPAGRLTTV